MTTIVKARAPLRLGLAGGGTDVSPFCDVHGGAVLNATIDRYAYAIVRTFDEPLVRLHAADQQRSVTLPLAAAYPLDGELNLLKAVYSATHPPVPASVRRRRWWWRCCAPSANG